MVATQQPTWELVANLGDNHPIQYGGFFVFKDSTGVYDDEVEYLTLVDEDSDNPTWLVYRFGIDRLSLHNGNLLPFGFHERTDLPHPIDSYTEWFSDKLADIVKASSMPVDELRTKFTSEDPQQRAFAYREIGEYFGYDNLDSYPLTFKTVDEVVARYKHLDGKINISIRETL